MSLRDLGIKFAARASKRARQKALFEKTHKKGYAKAAARNGSKMRKLRALISVAKRKAKRQGGTFAEIKSIAPGRPHWGGGADLMGQFVAPYMARAWGLAKGSGKRTPAHNAAIGGSPTSDHLTTQTLTFARDFPTFDGERAARALAKALGSTMWEPNSYATFDIVVDGHVFRIQILWGSAIGHGDHIHVGIAYLGEA